VFALFLIPYIHFPPRAPSCLLPVHKARKLHTHFDACCVRVVNIFVSKHFLFSLKTKEENSLKKKKNHELKVKVWSIIPPLDNNNNNMLVTADKQVNVTGSKSPTTLFNLDHPNLNWSFHTSTENIKLPFVDDPDDDHDHEEVVCLSEQDQCGCSRVTQNINSNSATLAVIEQEILTIDDDDDDCGSCRDQNPEQVR
jgi:hypothetical protein